MNRTGPACRPWSLCLSLAVAVIVAAVAGTTEPVLACGFCITPRGGLTAIHPKSLDVAVAIRRDIESGLLKPNPTMPESKADRHFRDLQTGRMLAQRLSLREGFVLLLIEDGSHYQVEGAPHTRGQVPSSGPSTRWVTGRAVLQSLLKKDMDYGTAVKRGLIILEKSSNRD